MKKICVFTLLISLILSSVCSARIHTEKDNFYNTTILSSNYTKDSGFLGLDHNNIQFARGFGTKIEYLLVLKQNLTGNRGTPTFKDSYLKIDDNIFTISPFKSDIERIGDTAELEGYFEVPLDLIARIKYAQQVTIRGMWQTPDGAERNFIIEIPDNILKEWQRLISATNPDKY